MRPFVPPTDWKDVPFKPGHKKDTRKPTIKRAEWLKTLDESDFLFAGYKLGDHNLWDVCCRGTNSSGSLCSETSNWYEAH